MPIQIATLERLAATPPLISWLWVKRLCWLAVIIVVNCLVLAVAEGQLYWREFLYGTPPNYFPLITQNPCTGVLTAQFLFIGFWLALAPERLVVRIAVGSLLTGLLLAEYLFFIWLINDWALLGSELQGGSYCSLTVISLLLVRALRPWCGWRLGWDDIRPANRPRQFSILDLMTWTAALAVPMGLLQSIYGNGWLRVALIALFGFTMALPVSFPAFRWAVAADRRWRWLACLLVWGLLGPFLVAISWYLTPGGRTFLQVCLMEAAVWSAFYAPLLLVWVGNVLALERIGLRTWKKPGNAEIRTGDNV